MTPGTVIGERIVRRLGAYEWTGEAWLWIPS